MKHLVIVGVVSFFAALGSAFKIGKVLEISPFTELPNCISNKIFKIVTR